MNSFGLAEAGIATMLGRVLVLVHPSPACCFPDGIGLSPRSHSLPCRGGKWNGLLGEWVFSLKKEPANSRRRAPINSRWGCSLLGTSMFWSSIPLAVGSWGLSPVCPAQDGANSVVALDSIISRGFTNEVYIKQVMQMFSDAQN